MSVRKARGSGLFASMIAVMHRIVHTALALCLASPLAACPPLNVEVLGVDTGLAGAEPSLVRADDGFVLTWQARLDDGVAALRFRHLALDGRSLATGEIARGTGWFLNWADFPSLQVLDNGDWIAHWLQRSGPGRYSYDIRATRSQDRGATWSTPFTLHDDGTQSEHGFVAYAPAADDGAWVAWLDGRQTVGAAGLDDGSGHAHGHGGAAMSLRMAKVTRSGVIWNAALDDRVCDCCQIAATRAAAATLVVYRDRGNDDIRDISLLRHDGQRWLPSQPLFADGWKIAGCPVNGPTIAARGRHAAAAAYSEAGGIPTVRMRRSDDAGRSWSKPVAVVAGGTLGRLHLAVLEDGRTLLARMDAEGDEVVLRLSLHGEHGETLAQREVVRRKAGQLPGFPRLALDGRGGVLAWSEAPAGQPHVRLARVHAGDCAAAGRD